MKLRDLFRRREREKKPRELSVAPVARASTGDGKQFVVAREFAKDMPQGIRHHLLYAETDILFDLAGTIEDEGQNRVVRFAAHSYWEETERIFGLWLDRQNEAWDCEQEGEIEQAIKLYERNVREMCHLWKSYERLRIIYRKQKDYDKAVRACERWLNMRRVFEAAGFWEKSEGPDHFASWKTKLEASAEKARMAKGLTGGGDN